MKLFRKILSIFFCAASLFCAVATHAQVIDTLTANYTVSTTAVTDDADDPAFWIHPTMPESSLVIGTDKGTITDGGLYVWNLNGTLQQYLALKHPNNVDVRYGVSVKNVNIDVVVVSMRTQSRILIFKVDVSTRTLIDLTSNSPIIVPNLPYGLTLYRRPRDGALYAFVSSKHPDYFKKIVQLRLTGENDGKVHGRIVRELTAHNGIIEGMVADEQLGYLYCAESDSGIHKYYADNARHANRLALIATEKKFNSDRKGLALYQCPDSTGYLLVASPDDQSIKVYPRSGPRNAPHEQPLLAVIRNVTQKYGVGLEVASQFVSRRFPRGVLIWHDEKDRKFRLYPWEKVAQGKLLVCEPKTNAVAENFAHGPAQQFFLQQNYPNPFSLRQERETEISFQLLRAGEVELRVYNLLGQPVRNLVRRALSAGEHKIYWDGRDDAGEALSSGVYLYQLRQGGFSHMRKMTLLH